MKSFLLAWRMEVFAPISGGSIFAILVKWAPIISLIFGFTGVILGFMTYRLKLKKHRVQMKLLEEQKKE